MLKGITGELKDRPPRNDTPAGYLRTAAERSAFLTGAEKMAPAAPSLRFCAGAEPICSQSENPRDNFPAFRRVERHGREFASEFYSKRVRVDYP